MQSTPVDEEFIFQGFQPFRESNGINHAISNSKVSLFRRFRQDHGGSLDEDVSVHLVVLQDAGERLGSSNCCRESLPSAGCFRPEGIAHLIVHVHVRATGKVNAIRHRFPDLVNGFTNGLWTSREIKDQRVRSQSSKLP